jgi:hypothetical protein
MIGSHCPRRVDGGGLFRKAWGQRMAFAFAIPETLLAATGGAGDQGRSHTATAQDIRAA